MKFTATYGTTSTTFNVTDRGGDSLLLSTLRPKIERQWGVYLTGTEARVNGSLKSADYIVEEGARIEFVKPCGSKA